MPHRNIGKDILLGVAIGDALGVPVEFISREKISHQPVTDMKGYGTYNLPPGTFSDDSSLTFCLAEALSKPFTLQNLADYFIDWLYNNYWTARGTVFDVGNATRTAISLLKKGCPPELAGGTDIDDNGNGSLMRILPLIVYTKDLPVEKRFELTKLVSSITHGHIRSVIACFYYLEFARKIITGANKNEAYQQLQTEIPGMLNSLQVNPDEISKFNRLLKGQLKELDETEIFSTGYVLHTLEAAIWCILNTNDYKSAVLKAVNLGSDSDTTGAVTGGLAGLLYGWESIPEIWIQQLARFNEIYDLANRLYQLNCSK